MKLNELFPSKWMSKDDIPHPITVTIQNVTKQEVNDDGGKAMKAVLVFDGGHKPMILNRVNGAAIAELYGDDTANWIGKKVEIYVDPNVQMRGERVGGLRFRPPHTYAPAPAPSTSHNGTGMVGRWDISDGTKEGSYSNLTADDARKTIMDSGRPASAWKAKPAGAPRELAKPAQECGIITALQTANEDPIPF